MQPSPPTSRHRILIAMEGVLGGTLRHLDYLLRLTDPQQWDVHLAVSSVRAPHVEQDFQRWESMGWHVHRIPMRRRVDPLSDLRAFQSLLGLCRKHQFDVVHTHCAKAGFLGRLAAFQTQIPAVHTPHVFPFTHVGGTSQRHIYRTLEKAAARWTRGFVVLSDFQKNVAIHAGLTSPEECDIIPNGIIPSDFQGPPRRKARERLNLSPDRPIALFVGRFRPQKGLDILLDAASQLKNTTSPTQILIVGEGPQERWLNRQIKGRGLEDRVFNHGFTEQMHLYYAASDLVVMPSRAEGMPYVVLEAHAAGRPVAVTLVSGMEELIQHGSNGYLMPTENADALADILQNKLRDRKTLHVMGEFARDRFPNEWHAQQMVERTCHLWARIVEARKLPQQSLH